MALYTYRYAAEAIPQYSLVKLSTTAGWVEVLKLADNPLLAVGVAITRALSAGVRIQVQEITGVETTMLSDGTSTIVPGDFLEPTDALDGHVRKGSVGAIAIGIATGSAAATVGVQVAAIFYKPLSAVAGGGTIGGTVTAGQIPYASANDTLASSSKIQWDGSAIFVEHPAVGLALGTTGIAVLNSTPATNGNQQYSPALSLYGQGFASGPVASQVVKYSLTVVPTQGVANPTAALWIYEDIDGGSGAGALMKIGSTGTEVVGHLTFDGYLLDLSGGATNGQALVYDSGTSRFKAATVAGGSTLSAAYAAGASQANSTFALDSTRLGIKITDNATPITGALFSVQNSGGPTVKFFDIGATQTQVILSGMADGAAAIAAKVDTQTTWSNATAKLFTVRNANAEKFAVLASGDYNASTDGFWYDAANQRLNIGTPTTPTGRLTIQGTNGSQSQMRIENSTGPVKTLLGAADSPAGAFIGSLSAHPLYLRHTNNNIIAMSATDFSPVSTNTVDIGLTGTRFKSLFLSGNITASGTLTAGTISGVGYIGSSDQTVLGAASTSSTSYVDVGNGSSTGFASWTAPATPVTKTYTLNVSVCCYMSAIGSNATVQFQVVQDGLAISGHPTNINRVTLKTSGDYGACSFSVAVPQTATVAHVYKLQWKVLSGDSTADVSAGVGQVQFYLTG